MGRRLWRNRPSKRELHRDYWQGVIRVGRRNVWVSRSYLDRSTALYDAESHRHLYGSRERRPRVYVRRAK